MLENHEKNLPYPNPSDKPSSSKSSQSPLLHEKILILQSENVNLEKTIVQLRHEISNLTEKRKLDQITLNSESIGYKYHALSTELSRCLENSGCELTKFSKSYDQAIKALNNWGDGFNTIISSMKNRLLPASKHNLDFMHTILDELYNLRAQLTIVQNYVAVLEFNESSLRDSIKKTDKKNLTSRSVSVNRMDEISKEDGDMMRGSKDFVLDIAPCVKMIGENRFDELKLKINKLKLSLCKLKNQRDRAKIDNERLLLQLKQTKEQLAIAEESASGREVSLENKVKELSQILYRLKENPKIEEIVNKFEEELAKTTKKHSRTRSNIIIYNR